MKNFRLALVQHDSPLGKVDANLDTTERLARLARKRGGELIAFPELNITGHGGHPIMIRNAQRVPDGDACRRLAALAAELGVYISAGLAEADGSAVYNTQCLFGPNGFIGKQRKVHLSMDEYFFFRGGTSVPVFDLPFAKVGIVICYDNNVPEMARCLAVQGAELILAPHAARIGPWPASAAKRRGLLAANKKSWKLIHACRSYDNGLYVALCNTAGRSAVGLKNVHANHAGGCVVFGPDGQLVAESRSRDIQEEVLVVNLSAERLTQRREAACFNLRTRRPEVFYPLVEQQA